jgi:chromosome segregation ATPase
MKKNTKKNETDNNDIISEIKEEFKRHTNILMEQMKHEVKSVAEGHGSIIRKLEEHDKRFDKVDAKLVEHDKKFAEHDKKFAKIESELQSISMAVMDTGHEIKEHGKRIKKVEEKVFV